VSLQEAELALVQNDSVAGVRAMRLALSAEPGLSLDEGRVAPPLVALLARARAELGRVRPLSVTFISEPPGARVWAAGAWRGETPLSVALPEGPTLVWIARHDYRIRTLVTDIKDGLSLTTALDPIAPPERLRPLVDAVRETAGEARRESALALAAAVGVDAVLVVDAAVSPALYARELAAEPAVATSTRVVGPPPTRRRPWYKKAWPWVLIVGGAAAVATSIGLGVALGSSTTTSITCCR